MPAQADAAEGSEEEDEKEGPGGAGKPALAAAGRPLIQHFDLAGDRASFAFFREEANALTGREL